MVNSLSRRPGDRNASGIPYPSNNSHRHPVHHFANDRDAVADPMTLSERSPALRQVATVLFWLALATAVTMAGMRHPPHLPIDRFGDKFEHALAFATLTVLGDLAFPRMPRLLLVEHLSFLGALIEVMQSIPSLHRDCDIFDWITDTAAILVVTGAIWAWRRLR